MKDLRCKWFTAPLRAKVVEIITEYDDVYLMYSCPGCDYIAHTAESKIPPYSRVRYHVKSATRKHSFASLQNVRLQVWRPQTLGEIRFVAHQGVGVKTRWGCAWCLEYFKSKNEFIDHFNQVHYPTAESSSKNSQPISPSAFRDKILLPTSLPMPANANSRDDLNDGSVEDEENDDDEDDVFQKPLLPMPAPRPLRSSPRNKGKGKAKVEPTPPAARQVAAIKHGSVEDENDEDDDDDFQKPLPMPAPRPLRSSPRNKGKGKARVEPTPPAARPKLERNVSFIAAEIAKINIERDGGYASSSVGSNTASTSTCNSVVCNSNAASPASLDETEYELDGSVVDDSAVASPSLLSALTEFDPGSHKVYGNGLETQDDDEAALDLTLSDILASRVNPNLASQGSAEEDELVDEYNLSSSSSEAALDLTLSDILASQGSSEEDELADEYNLSSSSSEAESTPNDHSDDDHPFTERRSRYQVEKRKADDAKPVVTMKRRRLVRADLYTQRN